MQFLRSESTRHKALTYKSIAKEGNFIFDVTVRYSDDSVGTFLTQARTAREAERNLLGGKAVVAVARKIYFGD